MFFIEIYTNIEKKLKFKIVDNSFLATFPKYPIELIGIIILLIGMILKIQNFDSVFILTTIGTFAFAAQKLLPTIQNIYFSWSSINSRMQDIEKVYKTISKETKFIKRTARQKNFFGILSNLIMFLLNIRIQIN